MPPSAPGRPSELYAWFALALLFVVALFNYMDRSILSIMQVALKKDLRLSDTELGTLTGLSFALFYTTLALPIARLTDRMSRKYMLAGALVVWTAMTALSALARGYWTLLGCRIGVAVGESGCVPASHSLISDYFPRHRRALAMAVWGMSLPLGAMLGIGLGGVLTAAFGWRETFALVGLSGLAMTPVVLIFLKEPMRGRYDGATAAHEPQARPLGEVLGIFWRTRSFRYFVIGVGLQAWAQSAIAAWNAPFYSRVHHVPLATLATVLALITGLGGAVGTFAGGALTTRLARTDIRWYMGIPAIAAFLITPFAIAQLLVADPRLSLVFAVVPAVMGSVYLAPGNAMSQSLMPANTRAFTAAVCMLSTGLLGGALGPTSVGIMSDALIKLGYANTSLRLALLPVTLPALAAAALFYRSSVHLPKELRPLHGPADAVVLPAGEIAPPA
jgi:predicted MFS family arabinose efflux permease